MTLPISQLSLNFWESSSLDDFPNSLIFFSFYTKSSDSAKLNVVRILPLIRILLGWLTLSDTNFQLRSITKKGGSIIQLYPLCYFIFLWTLFPTLRHFYLFPCFSTLRVVTSETQVRNVVTLAASETTTSNWLIVPWNRAWSLKEENKNWENFAKSFASSFCLNYEAKG